MKAIILASGEGSRLRPLTDTTPKPLIKILGKPLIQYNLEILSELVEECIIVVKYKHELFQQAFGKSFGNMKLSYHIQGDTAGTGAAISDINGIQQDEKVIILYGDSIYPKQTLETLISTCQFGCLVKEVSNPEIYGIFEEKNGKAIKIVEKPDTHIGNLANMGGFLVSGEIISLAKDISVSPRGEYEITDAIQKFINTHDFYLQRLTEDILDIGYAWNLLDANKYYLENLKSSDIRGIIEENVQIQGNIILEEGAVIKSGTYIEGNCYFGKNTIIGPNAYVRGNTSLGEGGKIGFSVEVKNSYIGDNTKIPHLSYVGDSIFGNNINIGCGFKVANLRHDGKNLRVLIKGKLVDTGKRKLGCIIGDNVKTGINTMVYPGRVLETGTGTLPGEIIK
ncbi:NTP transferase domain-containing protein [Candidatus Gracilibacteria bacterium]|nr:NTP transferase domain-containing protein [Candidatus Gracilibacteria bacterium]